MDSNLKVNKKTTQFQYLTNIIHIPQQNNQMLTIAIFSAKRSDLDMNHHVNNVKYVRWMLEVIHI